MNKTQEIFKVRHCVFAIHMHLIFAIKYRRGIFRQEHMAALERLLRSVCEDFETPSSSSMGMPTPVHLLIHYLPKSSSSMPSRPDRLDPDLLHDLLIPRLHDKCCNCMRSIH